MQWSAANLSQELPGYEQYTRRLRNRESHAASRALMLAAVLCLVRAALLPWLMHYRFVESPDSDVQVVFMSVICMSGFTICSLWARFCPLGAALVALAFFVSLGVRDWLANPDIMAQALVFKGATFLLLLRSLMNSVLSRTL